MTFAILVLAATPLFLPPPSPSLQILSVKRIWNKAPHSAFGDLIRFRNQWVCVFREGTGHVASVSHPNDGKLRVLLSADGDDWQSAALISEDGIDLRDPHLSITASGRLMIVAGGSEYPNGVYRQRQSRVLFSNDAKTWTEPAKVLEPGHWLWRVTWHNGVAYGVSKYGSPSRELPENPRRTNLVKSKDGLHWETITELKVPGSDETSVRFTAAGRMVLFMRTRSLQDEMAQVGWSDAPYTNWHFTKQNTHVGGPNLIILPDGTMIAGGRHLTSKEPRTARTAIGPMTLTEYQPQLILPSGGDNSYPGFVFHEGVLWTLYYSSHESNTAIYLAKIRVQPPGH